MTKRRDRNRTARRRKRVYIWHWTSGTSGEYHAALVELITQNLTTTGRNTESWNTVRR